MKIKFTPLCDQVDTCTCLYVNGELCNHVTMQNRKSVLKAFKLSAQSCAIPFELQADRLEN